MTVILFPNMTRNASFKVTNDVVAQLEKNNIKYYINNDLKEKFCKLNEDCFIDLSDGPKDSEMIIAIGGDGTIIRAAVYAANYDIPVLGINAGNLAYLMGLEKDELSLLSMLNKNNYSVEERIMLDVSVVKNGNVIETVNCINDAVIARGKQIQLANINVLYNGKLIDKYKCDGMIVSTPTGSTAYNLAASGPIVDPQVDAILMTPICSHSLTARPLVFKSDSIITVINPPENRTDLFLSCDGNEDICLDINAYVEIKKSKLTPKFIKLKKDSFLDILHIKLKD